MNQNKNELIHLYDHSHTHTRTCTQTHSHTDMHTHTHTHTHNTCTHTDTQHMHTHMHTHTDTTHAHHYIHLKHNMCVTSGSTFIALRCFVLCGSTKTYYLFSSSTGSLDCMLCPCSLSIGLIMGWMNITATLQH